VSLIFYMLLEIAAINLASMLPGDQPDAAGRPGVGGFGTFNR
jgi:hypothetical protein